MNTSCCQCGVPFKLSITDPILHIERPYGKATCYDCMKCLGCNQSLAQLKTNNTTWLWLDIDPSNEIGGPKCLTCLRKVTREPITKNSEHPADPPISNPTSGNGVWQGVQLKSVLIGGLIAIAAIMIGYSLTK